MTIFYFTSTGNGLQVCKAIGGKHISIVQALKSDTIVCEDDAIGVVFPCWLHDVPAPVQAFLQRAQLKADYIFAVMSYGLLDGAAMRIAAKLFSSRGIRLDYLNRINMADNFLPAFDMQSQMKSLPKKRVEERLSAIADDIQNRKVFIKRFSPLRGLWAWPVKAVAGAFETLVRGKLTAKDTCTMCGTCAKACPVDNITIDDHVVFGTSCIGCLCCAHICPANAIRQKGERSRARYRNPHVKPKEIIDANK